MLRVLQVCGLLLRFWLILLFAFLFFLICSFAVLMWVILRIWIALCFLGFLLFLCWFGYYDCLISGVYSLFKCFPFVLFSLRVR